MVIIAPRTGGCQSVDDCHNGKLNAYLSRDNGGEEDSGEQIGQELEVFDIFGQGFSNEISSGFWNFFKLVLTV